MKLTLSPAFVTLMEQDVLAFITQLTQKHLGTQDAEAVQAVGTVVATVANSAAGMKPTSETTTEAPVSLTSGGKTNAADTAVDTVGDVAAMTLAEAEPPAPVY